MQTDYRHVLKDATQADHQRVDSLLSTLDVTDREGFAQFLLTHLTCYSAMSAAAEPGSYAHDCLLYMSSSIFQDLTDLGCDQRQAPSYTLPKIEPLALDYMIEGSRLGTKVLKKRWAKSNDPVVRGADAYFSMPPAAGRWREVCDTLSAVPSQSVLAAVVACDTKILFAMFHDVAAKIQSGPCLTKEPIQ